VCAVGGVPLLVVLGGESNFGLWGLDPLGFVLHGALAGVWGSIHCRGFHCSLLVVLGVSCGLGGNPLSGCGGLFRIPGCLWGCLGDPLGVLVWGGWSGGCFLCCRFGSVCWLACLAGAVFGVVWGLFLVPLFRSTAGFSFCLLSGLLVVFVFFV